MVGEPRLDYQRDDLPPRSFGTCSPGLLAPNPNARVPALDVLEIALQRSSWLAGDDFGVADPNVASADRMAKAVRRFA